MRATRRTAPTASFAAGAIAAPALLALAAAAGGGCSRPPATGLVLEVASDLAVPDEMSALGVRAVDGEGGVLFSNVWALGPEAGAYRLPARLGLVSGDGSEGTVVVTVTGLLGTDEVVSRRVITFFLRGEVHLVRVELLRACRGFPCPDNETCGPGPACEDPHRDPSTLPPFDRKADAAGNPEVAVPEDGPEADGCAGIGVCSTGRGACSASEPCASRCSNLTGRTCASATDCRVCNTVPTQACTADGECPRRCASDLAKSCGSDSDCGGGGAGTCSGSGAACADSADCNRCSNDATRKCASATDCGKCSNAPTKTCTTSADCKVSCQGTCAHDVCTAGVALASGCHACATAVCAADPYCCSSSWDTSCVSEVATYCAASGCSCGTPGTCTGMPSLACTTSANCRRCALDTTASCTVGADCWRCSNDSKKKCAVATDCGDMGKCSQNGTSTCKSASDCWRCSNDVSKACAMDPDCPGGMCSKTGFDGGCDDDGCGAAGGPSKLTMAVTSGVTYGIIVDGKTPSAAGAYSLNVAMRLASPATTSCATPASFDYYGGIQYGTLPSGASAVTGSCGGDGPEAVFRWYAPSSGTVTVNTCGSGTDTVLYVRSSTCTGTEVACNDEGGACGPGASALSFTATGGTYYYVFVDKKGAGGGLPYTVQLAGPKSSVGASSCAAPWLVSGYGGSYTGTTSGASALSGACGGDGPEAVFSWTPYLSGTAVISTCGSAFDTVAYVRMGGCTLACKGQPTCYAWSCTTTSTCIPPVGCTLGSCTTTSTCTGSGKCLLPSCGGSGTCAPDTCDIPPCGGP